MIFRGRREKCGVMSNDVSLYCQCCIVDRDISVGIATRYGLERPTIESRWGGEIFRTLPDRHWGPPSLINWVLGLSREVKWPGRGVDHPPPSSTEVKEKVELYKYSSPGSS